MKSKSFLAAMLLLLCATQIWAYDFEANGLYYNILKDKTNEVEVTFRSYSSTKGYNYGWNITTADIPSSVEYKGINYSVTRIGEWAFFGCSGLTSVTISNCVTSIGGDAFENCYKLTSLTIPESVTNIGDKAFYGCSGLASVVIPNSVTSIGVYAFANCYKLTSLTIPESVTSIGDNAFYECSSLTSVTIPNSVTRIGEWAFFGCSGLTEVYSEPATPPTYGSGAFSGTTTPIYVADCALTAYQNAPGWKDLTIVPVAFNLLVVNNIGGSVINRCGENLVEALAYDGYHFVKWQDGNTDNPRSYALSDAEHNYIAQFAINRYNITLQCDASKGYITGDQGRFDFETEHTIQAFANYGYQFTQWSDGVTTNPRTFVLTQDTIFTAEFAIERSGTCGDDLKLTWTYEPESATLTISGNGTLNSNYTYGVEAPAAMRNLVLEDGVKSIGAEAFKDMTTLQNITIGNGVNKIGSDAFRSCGALEAVNIPAGVTSIVATAFADCGSLASITVDAANTIYDSRENCNAVIKTSSKTLVLGCKAAVIPNTVRSIGESAFADCGALTSIVIPNSVVSIGKYAFSECTGLTALTIPESVVGMGEGALRNCSELVKLTSEALEPPMLGDAVFEGVEKSIPLYVPAGSEDAYKEADQWKDFFNITNNLHSVVFLDWDGIVIARRTADHGETVTAPDEPARTGYVFNGWSRDLNNVTEDMFVIALYEKDNTNALPVYFVDNEGGIVLKAYVTEAVPQAPAWENHTFLDWITEEANLSNGITIRATYTDDMPTEAPAVEGQQSAASPRKVLRDGHVMILMPDGTTYDAAGRQVR